ncbi:tubulin alpha chain-like, partial [Sigmodon hispidus]
IMYKCIFIHVGQAGVQIGKDCWEIYCLEHASKLMARCKRQDHCRGHDFFNIFFSKTSVGKHGPWAVFIGLEPTVFMKFTVDTDSSTTLSSSSQAMRRLPITLPVATTP